MAAGRSSQDTSHLRVVKLAVPCHPRTSNLTGAALKYVVGYIDIVIEDGYISGQEPQSCMYVCTYTWEQDVMYHYRISRIFQYWLSVETYRPFSSWDINLALFGPVRSTLLGSLYLMDIPRPCKEQTKSKFIIASCINPLSAYQTTCLCLCPYNTLDNIQ